MEDVARVGRRLGFNWSSGSIASIEKGASRVTLETLIGLCISLARDDETALPLSELIPPDSDVIILPPVATKGANVLAWLQGDGDALGGVANMAYRIGEQARKNGKIGALDKLLANDLPSPAVIRLAKRIGQDADEVQYVSNRLWGKSFEQHRDELAGDDATPQKKGQVARRLQDELKAAFEAGDNGDD